MRYVWASALLFAAIGTAAADGDDPTPAQSVRSARSYEIWEDWRMAIRHYEQAYRVEPRPPLLFAIGVNHERLGENREAVTYYQRYLHDAGPAAHDRATVEARIDRLAKTWSRVSIATSPNGATVLVDGRELGGAPVAELLAPGAHTVLVHGDVNGVRASKRQTIVLEYGERLALAIDLVAPAPERERSGAQAVAGDAAMPTEAVSASASASPRERRFLIGAGWGMFPEDGEGARIALEAGVRALSDYVELSGLIGRFGNTLGRGYGAAARINLSTARRMNAYLRGAVLFGDGRGLEVGVGGRGKTPWDHLEAFVEIDLLRVTAGSSMDPDTSKIIVPVSAGMILSF